MRIEHGGALLIPFVRTSDTLASLYNRDEKVSYYLGLGVACVCGPASGPFVLHPQTPKTIAVARNARPAKTQTYFFAFIAPS